MLNELVETSFAVPTENHMLTMLKQFAVRLILRALDSLIEVTPENAFQFVRRGCVRANCGHYDDAVADFSIAIDLIPT